MNKKELTIRAIESLIEEYKEKAETGAYHAISVLNCPLCLIHTSKKYFLCKGCPMADEKGSDGCLSFNSLQSVISINQYKVFTSDRSYDRLHKEFYLARAAFHQDYLLPIVKDSDPKLFTKKGWKYFNLDYSK